MTNNSVLDQTSNAGRAILRCQFIGEDCVLFRNAERGSGELSHEAEGFPSESISLLLGRTTATALHNAKCMFIYRNPKFSSATAGTTRGKEKDARR